MTRARLLPALLVLLAPLAAVPLTAAPSGAEVVSITDKAGDGSAGRFGDLGRVKVNHAPRKVYTTLYPAKRGELADYYEIWVDTDAGRRGPEFVEVVYLEVEKVLVARANGFSYDSRKALRCATSLKADYTTRVLEATVPRACFKTGGVAPERVRLSVHARMDYGGADWAPGAKRFGPWVAHEV